MSKWPKPERKSLVLVHLRLIKMQKHPWLSDLGLTKPWEWNMYDKTFELFSTQKTCGTISFQIWKHCNLYNTLHKNIRQLDGGCWKVVVESISSPILLDFKTPECKLQERETTIRRYSCQTVFICWIWSNQYFLLKHASWWQRSTVPYACYNNICCWECI